MKETRRKILAVEDERPMSDVLKDYLTGEGFTVVLAFDGYEGLRIAEEEKPDLIVLDLVMPKMGGIEMLEKLRRTNWGKEIPVIVLSNLATQDAIVAAMKNLVFDYLIKTDWRLSELGKMVKRRLGL